MIEFPQSAKFGKRITLTQLKKLGLRARLAEMIKSIVWSYKLAPSTVNLAATESVKEIEVLDLTLRGEGDKPRNLALIVEALAKMIPNPCVCRLFFEDGEELGVAVCPKVSGGALYGDSPVYRMAKGNWSHAEARRDGEFSEGFGVSGEDHSNFHLRISSSPREDDVGRIWAGVTTLEALLMRVAAALAEMRVVPGETLKDFIARHYKLESLRADLGDIERKISRETQLDIKYQLSKDKQKLQKEIEKCQNSNM